MALGRTLLLSIGKVAGHLVVHLTLNWAKTITSPTHGTLSWSTWYRKATEMFQYSHALHGWCM